MQNQKVLEQLGYSAREAKVYLGILSLGEATVSDIATTLDMPRSTVQTVIDRLQADKLLQFYVIRRQKHWVAENPEQLLKILQEKEAIVEEALPKLTAKKEKGRERVKITKRQEHLDALCEVADGLQNPVLITDYAAEIQYVNKSWEKEFGYSCQDVFGQHILMVKNGQKLKEAYNQMCRALKRGKLFSSDALVEKKRNGKDFKVDMVAFPVTFRNRGFFVQISEILD